VSDAVDVLRSVKNNRGRVFVLGNGGSAATASHFVNDLRKVLGIEAYAPTESVSEMTARANDDGYKTHMEEYLKTSRLCNKDVVLVLTGSGESKNLRLACEFAARSDACIVSIVGKVCSRVAQISDICIAVPEINEELYMQHSETFQLAVIHWIVSCPAFKDKK
jgi:D-sedoheptulose 7-phosphate isomerase